MSTVVKMLIVAVVVTTSVLTSAQPTSQSSSQCNMTYNATFESMNPSDSACSVAFYLSLSGDATDEQKMMVCNAGQCNTRIENVISACSNTVSSYVKR